MHGCLRQVLYLQTAVLGKCLVLCPGTWEHQDCPSAEELPFPSLFCMTLEPELSFLVHDPLHPLWASSVPEPVGLEDLKSVSDFILPLFAPKITNQFRFPAHRCKLC